MERTARAFWLRSPGHGEIRDVPCRNPPSDEVVVRTLFSGVSRGTETLVFRGGVPESQHTAMRAPFQDGDFPGPVKYGYLNVGLVEEGPAAPRSAVPSSASTRTRRRYVVPASAVTPVPDTVPAARAVLAGTVETAVNALWDAAPLIGDRIAVVGAGMVGCSVAALLARFPAVRVQLVDADPARADIAGALGVDFALPEDAAGRLRPRRPRQRHRGRAHPLAGTPRPGGHGPRTELVRRPAGQPAARGGLPLRSPGPAQQPGGDRVPGPARPPYLRRPARARPRSARRPRLRRTDHRRMRLRGAAVGAGRDRRRVIFPGCVTACCTTRPQCHGFRPSVERISPLNLSGPERTAWSSRTTRQGPRAARRVGPGGSAVVQRHRPRSPHDRPQLPRRGLRSRAASARSDVPGGRHLSPRRAGRRQHRRRHRAGHHGTRTRGGRVELPQPRQRTRVRGHQHLDGIPGQGHRRPPRRPGARRSTGRGRPRPGRHHGHPARVAHRLGELRACSCEPRRCHHGDRALGHRRDARWRRRPVRAEWRQRLRPPSLPGPAPDRLAGPRARRRGQLATARATARTELARMLRESADGTVVLLDGLVACAVPEIVVPEAERLRLVVLVHLPLGDETGLTPAMAADLDAGERRTLRAVAAVVATSDWAAAGSWPTTDSTPAGSMSPPPAPTRHPSRPAPQPVPTAPRACCASPRSLRARGSTSWSSPSRPSPTCRGTASASADSARTPATSPGSGN